MNKKKILHIENVKNVTGSFRALLNMIDKQSINYTSIIALPKGNNIQHITEFKKIKCITFPFLELRKKILSIFLYIPTLLVNVLKVYNYCRNNDIRILHNNDHYNLVPILIKYLFGQLFIYIVHVRLLPSSYNKQLYSLYRFLNVKFADHIIFVSQAVSNAYRNPPRSSVIYDASVEPEIHGPFIVRETKKLKFLYLSNYINGKGQNHALKAFSEFRNVSGDKYSEIHFFGSTMNLKKNEDYKLQLNALTQTLGIKKNVFFNSEEEDVEKLYKEHDICLMFSESESFSMICLEAMSFGIPIIATDCGGPREIIDHKRNGLLVPNFDINAMCKEMYLLSKDFELRKQFNIESKKKVIKLLNQPKDFYAIADMVSPRIKN